MADKPILFSAPMIRALLDGRKTQTRRAIKARRKRAPSIFDGTWTDSYVMDPGNADWRARDLAYAPGDRLWCREAWRTAAAYDDLAPSQMGGEEPIFYEADGERRTWGHPVTSPKGRLRASMHMPRWASRLTLIVTDVRVERLQEITPADAIAEGCAPYANSATIDCDTPNPRDDFRSLWNSINGPGAWESNPWVSAISFSVHKANIDSPANAEPSP